MHQYSLSALRKRIASSSGLGLSSAKSASVFHTQARSLPALGFSSIMVVTEVQGRGLWLMPWSCYNNTLHPLKTYRQSAIKQEV